MGEIYKNPLRVYIVLGLLGLWGILAGLSLPISLFPNSSKPKVNINIPYGNLAVEDFYKSYGSKIENQLKGTIIDGKTISDMTAEYGKTSVRIRLEFEWGVAGEKALNEIQSVMAGLSAAWPEESRRFYSVNTWNENGGFLALSFYSSTRSMDDLYELLNPLVLPIQAKVSDADNMGLYNPAQKQIEITLNPERMATLQVTMANVEHAIQNGTSSLSGGSIRIGDSQMAIELPRSTTDIESLRNLPIYTKRNRIHLRDVADVQLKESENGSMSFKTSGVPSLILFASPKPGGNIKKMADDILESVNALRSQIPNDVDYKILVNPSEFINSSILSVTKEVALAAVLAVVILLIFIGSLKNVVTAAIEIPLSIIMAFIFMKMFGMNLNLISLGGLALSAGMNVDASVVVMENIFRKFDEAKGELSAEDRLRIVVEAVKEVWLPIMAATIASLVVFIPLIMTSGLTNAILGDLAKAVVFSHGMSAIVALILVPTVRLQMMQTEKSFHLVSPIEKQFEWLENLYAKSLRAFIQSRFVKYVAYAGVVTAVVGLSAFIIPRLPIEIIGRPETDWVIFGMGGSEFKEPRQIQDFTEKVEYEALQEFQDQVAYTFTQIQSNNSWIMMRLKNRKDMDEVWKRVEEKFPDTPTVYFWSEPWNPSEMPIPNPPHFRVEIRGGGADARAKVTEEIRVTLLEAKTFPRFQTRPHSGRDEEIIITPYIDVIQRQESLSISSLADFIRVATDGKNIGEMGIKTKTFNIELKMAKDRVSNIEGLKGLPVSVGDKIVPLSALANIRTQVQKPDLYRWNQSEMSILTGRLDESEKSNALTKRAEAEAVLAKWEAARKDKTVSVASVAPDAETQEALTQLKWAVILSVILIFVTMIIQFGDVVHSLLVLVAIPLGFIGVLVSLFVFGSTLSLNSVLGTILLNGIAVANSIILVDFMKKMVDSGIEPVVAAVQASRARLRPILMTSLTTVLGMTPIALGFGEGGRILQPLGIAVAGGLWISMLLTLFMVPSLQALYLKRKRSKFQMAAVQATLWTSKELDLQ